MENLESTQTHPLICRYTGITVGALTVKKVAGHIPFLSQWKESQAMHPLFSLEPNALLQFSRNAWNNFCSLTQEEASDPKITTKQEEIIRVTALALVHKLTTVDQTIYWMPTLQEVYINWTSLLQLSYWKNYLESKRFHFPSVRINRINNGIDLTGFIQDCWAVKKSYETKIIEIEEAHRAKTAEAALKSLRDEVAGKAPRSKKLLWRWFLAHIPSRYARDTEGWMWELFDAETEQEISEFTMADIDLFEEIFLCEVPTGSSISAAFLDRLRHKRTILETKFESFEILIPDAITAAVAAGTISKEEPKASDFANRAQFLVATARWKLATTDMSKHRQAAIAKQTSVTVKPTYVPDITEIIPSLADTEDEDETTSIDIVDDETITGEQED